MILFIIVALNKNSKNIAAGKHIFSEADRCSIGFVCVCMCIWSCVARDVRPDTICFGCISMYFATPNTDRMTTTIIVRNANVLILVRIISPLNELNMFLTVHRIITKTAFGFKRILAEFGLKRAISDGWREDERFYRAEAKSFFEIYHQYLGLRKRLISAGGEMVEYCADCLY